MPIGMQADCQERHYKYKMDIENFNQNKDINFEDLQEFINSPELDLPEMRRDLSKEENVRWLLRNIMIRNKDNVSESYLKALKKTI